MKKNKLFVVIILVLTLCLQLWSQLYSIGQQITVDVPIDISFTNATGIDINIKLNQLFIDKAELINKATSIGDAFVVSNKTNSTFKVAIASSKPITNSDRLFTLRLTLKKEATSSDELFKIVQLKIDEKIEYQANNSVLISGVVNDVIYSKPIVVSFNEGSALLNGKAFSSGSSINSEGANTLIITDLNNKKRTVKFIQDFTPPVISIQLNKTTPTNQNVVATATVNEGALNKSTHTFTQNGSFEFVATDQAGNVSKKIVEITNIDKSPPVISGVENDMFYNKDLLVSFNEGTAKINGNSFISGNKISQEQSHTLVVTDSAGNATIVKFVIDKTAPVIIGKNSLQKNVPNGSKVDGAVTVTTQEANLSKLAAKKNNQPITFPSDGTFKDDGIYIIEAIDKANNVSTFQFTIEIPKKITSVTYSVSDSGTISKIPIGVTASQFKSNLSEPSKIKVYNGNNEIPNAFLVGTGMVVKLYNGNNVVAQYTIIVTGDLNGDGKVNVTDMVSIKSHILGKTKQISTYAKAADVNGDGKVNITDFIQIKSHILGKDKIKARQY